MVKASKKQYSEKPGPKVATAEVRTERLAMRVHPDLLEILDRRSKESNVSRSAYVEQLLVAWIRADPRNPKVDIRGKRVDGATIPAEQIQRDAFGFAGKWKTFSDIHKALLGAEPPQKWVTDRDDYWFGEDDDN